MNVPRETYIERKILYMKMRVYNVYYACVDNINCVQRTQYFSDNDETLIKVLNKYYSKSNNYVLLRIEEVTS